MPTSHRAPGWSRLLLHLPGHGVLPGADALSQARVEQEASVRPGRYPQANSAGHTLFQAAGRRTGPCPADGFVAGWQGRRFVVRKRRPAPCRDYAGQRHLQHPMHQGCRSGRQKARPVCGASGPAHTAKNSHTGRYSIFSSWLGEMRSRCPSRPLSADRSFTCRGGSSSMRRSSARPRGASVCGRRSASVRLARSVSVSGQPPSVSSASAGVAARSGSSSSGAAGCRASTMGSSAAHRVLPCPLGQLSHNPFAGAVRAL